jgi:hypothetical protein
MAQSGNQRKKEGGRVKILVQNRHFREQMKIFCYFSYFLNMLIPIVLNIVGSIWRMLLRAVLEVIIH